jgi:hypothetical protein
MSSRLCVKMNRLICLSSTVPHCAQNTFEVKSKSEDACFSRINHQIQMARGEI